MSTEQYPVNHEQPEGEQSTESTASPPVEEAGRKRSRRGCFGTFLMSIGLLVVFSVSLIFVLLLVAMFRGVSFPTAPPARFEEKVVRRVPEVDEKISIIEVGGLISFASSRAGGNANQLLAQVRQAARDPNVAAIVLDINTPGGEVIAVDEVHYAIRNFAESGKPVVSVIRSMGASGGYYIAAAADHIVANPMTLTGSIGVMVPHIEYSELLDKIGISYTPYKSGVLKDFLSGGLEREPGEQELIDAHMKEIIEGSFRRFAQVVADGRADYESAESVMEADFGDGRILSGIQAEELGLVDDLGHLDTGLAKAEELAGLEKANVVRYHQPWSFRNLPFMGDGEEINLFKLDGGALLESGQGIYYLMPGLR